MERGYKIKSKPSYQALTWRDKAFAHVVMAKGAGGMAVLHLFQQMIPPQAVTVFYVRDNKSKDYSDILDKVVGDDLRVFESEMDALYSAYQIMSECRMGTQFYVAGSEGFIWSFCKLATLHDVQDREVMKELCGSLARSVYCVHCKATTHDVITNIVPCCGCGRSLFVRDHFSRHLGSYSGLMIDAENPGEIPEIQEIYP